MRTEDWTKLGLKVGDPIRIAPAKPSWWRFIRRWRWNQDRKKSKGYARIVAITDTSITISEEVED